MKAPLNHRRRVLLRRLAVGLALAPAVALDSRLAAGAETLPLLSESDPAAKAEQYVADAKQAKGASPGALCSNCSIYGGAEGAAQGTCTLFPGKLVKAAGCASPGAVSSRAGSADQSAGLELAAIGRPVGVPVFEQPHPAADELEARIAPE
jgi:hypothetical protein